MRPESGLIAKFEPAFETVAEMSDGARFNAVLVGSCDRYRDSRAPRLPG